MGGMSAHLPHRKVSGHTPRIDARIAAVAARQHDLIQVEQLLALGLTDSALAKRVARGTLHRRHRGVYSLGSAPLSREAAWHAATLGCGAGAGVSRIAAAQLYMVTRSRTALITVVSPRRRTLKGVRVHHCRTLDPRDITTHRGIPVTTFARTLVDLSDVQTADELAFVIHEGAYRGLFSELATADAKARARGRHNLHVLDAALALHRQGSAGTKSAYERTYRRLVAQLEPSLPNTRVCGFEVDCHWPTHRLIVEVDGPGHARPKSRADDARRDRVLRAAGFRVLRFTDEDLEQRPGTVLRRTAAALAARRAA